jgi:PAS domain S-box-containing protein
MQNEELHQVQKDLEASHARYFKLYDLAPIGYLTLDKDGFLIREANLTAIQMLGVERSLIIGQPIARFIHGDDKDLHYLHLKKLFDTGLSQECELRLVKKDGFHSGCI